MSNSRTLLRGHKNARTYRDEEGQLVLKRRVKPGTPFRRKLWEIQDGPYERSYHSTKGYRCVRIAT